MNTLLRRTRLTDDRLLMRPWRRAKELTRCYLYWLPVVRNPMPAADLAWLQCFYDHFIPALTSKYELRPELFVHAKALYPHLMDEFARTSMEFGPLIGLSRRPRTAIPAMLNEAEIADMIQGKKIFDFRRDLPDYSYWFTRKNERKQRQSFVGYGGLTMAFLPPDPGTKAPPLPFSPAMRRHPIFQQVDVDALHAQTFALTDKFQQRSKELLGPDLANHPQYPGLRFILPLMKAEDFFCEAEATIREWLEVYPVLAQESPVDNGILLASKFDLDEDLIQVLEAMPQLERCTYHAEPRD